MNLRVWAVQDQGCLCAMVQEGLAIYTTPSPSILLIEEADIQKKDYISLRKAILQNYAGKFHRN